MEELRIIYTIPKKVKIAALVTAAFLIALSAGLAGAQALAGKFDFVFYAALAGVVVGVVAALMVTVWQSDLMVLIDDEEFRIKLPKQRIDGSILWETVTQLGIGLSYITLNGSETNYKIDLGNMKYNDLKRIKTKLIEVCEAKNIPFNNL